MSPMGTTARCLDVIAVPYGRYARSLTYGIMWLFLIFMLGRGHCLVGSEVSVTPRTVFEIHGEDFFCNGRPTYEGRVWQGHRVEGLLSNIRVVQATFDDLNPATSSRWAYPDTGKWDAERNTTEFIQALPLWKSQGLLAVCLNFQGGSPEGYSNAQPWLTSGFEEDGTLRPEFIHRMRRILDATDRLGMAVILGYFYFGQDQHLRDEKAVLRAVDQSTQWILDGGWRHVLIEIANETDHPNYDHPILNSGRIHELIRRVQDVHRDGRRLLVGTSCCGGVVPNEMIVRTSDFLLLHGNGLNDPMMIGDLVRKVRQVPGYRPMPIVFNEDDHEGFDQPVHHFGVAVAHHTSWGWFDFRRQGEGFAEGYQSLPVDWGIHSARKRAFFAKLFQITKDTTSP